MQTKISIAFDINGVLTEPIFQQLFDSLDRSKCHLIVWSSMGASKAKDFCTKNQLVADEYLDKQSKKIDIAIDDHPEMILSAIKVLGVKQ
ncbi:hypothetical protein KKI22_00740 [Patescibacteria group bacterium]|nr:hypothetical protein [Patescibacteria group bacterium]